MSSDAVKAKLKAKLKEEEKNLWESPYTPPQNGGAEQQSLATRYAEELGLDVCTVATSLEELRLHSVAKLAQILLTLNAKVHAQGGSKGAKEARQGGSGGGAGGAEADKEKEVKASGTGEVRLALHVTKTGTFAKAKIAEELGFAEVKVIAEGHVLRDEGTLREQGWKPDHERGGRPLQAIILGKGQWQPPRPSPGAAEDVPQPPAADPAAAAAETNGHATVAQLRDAAEALTREGFGAFDLADAKTGQIVPVPDSARQALLTAMVLHARGADLLADRENEESAASALEFLVEADRHFKRCGAEGAEQLLHQMDNFGRLQLDICWGYAKLGDIDKLPDAEERLALAEKAIERQVDRNFVTLAELKAREGMVLPPDIVPFARLSLLRGLARWHRGDERGQEDMARARTFFRGLQVNETDVQGLLVLGASRLEAVAALRRSAGSVDKAGEAIVAAQPEREAAEKKRAKQRKLGRCADGSFVDPDLVQQLRNMGFEKTLAIEALKQGNNRLEAAVAAAQTLQEMDGLAPKRARTGDGDGIVDEVSLALLMSMGIGQEMAEAALREHAGNVESAMAALTGQGPSIPAEPVAEEPRAEDAAAEPSPQEAMLEMAREVVERELGDSLRRADLDDDVAGMTFDEEELLLQQFQP